MQQNMGVLQKMGDFVVLGQEGMDVEKRAEEQQESLVKFST